MMFQCYVIFVCCVQLADFLNAGTPTTLPPFDDPFPVDECGGVDIADTVGMEPSGPPQNPADNDPKDFVPFKPLFLIDPGIDKVDKDLLEKVSKRVAHEMQQMMKGPRLNEIRFSRHRNPKNRNVCFPRKCRAIPIPAEYSLRCQANPDDPDNGPEEPSDEVKRMNGEGYSLVVVVAVYGQGWLANASKETCPAPGIVARASMCETDPATRRPNHGAIVWCHTPSKTAVFNTFFHETFHIVVPHLVGSYYPDNQCLPWAGEEPGVRCKGKTWQERIADNWLLENGTSIKLPTYFVTMSNLPTMVQDYLQCKDVPGAALNLKQLQNGTFVPDFSHWNERYFPEEILMPLSSPAMVITNVTLAALDAHSKWYTVNFTYASPLRHSRGAGCDFLAKSCYELFNEKRSGPRDELINLFGYCDNTRSDGNRIIPTSLCSKDHRGWFFCKQSALSSDFCPVKYVHVGIVPGYDHWICDETRSLDKQSAAAKLGGTFGADTICMTIVNAPHYKRSMRSVCVKHECDPDSSTLLLHLKSARPEDQTEKCSLKCSEAQSNKVVSFAVDSSCGGGGHEPITVLCPDYDQVCKKSMTVKTTVATTSMVQTTIKTTSTVKTTMEKTSTVQTTLETTSTSAADCNSGVGGWGWFLKAQAFIASVQITHFLWFHHSDNGCGS